MVLSPEDKEMNKKENLSLKANTQPSAQYYCVSGRGHGGSSKEATDTALASLSQVLDCGPFTVSIL